MIHALSVGAMTLAATAVAGFPAVETLRRFKLGKQISEWGPESHMAKAGTPTMGGLLILAAVLIFSVGAALVWHEDIWLPVAVMAALAGLGFLDALGSLQGRAVRGVHKRGK